MFYQTSITRYIMAVTGYITSTFSKFISTSAQRNDIPTKPGTHYCSYSRFWHDPIRDRTLVSGPESNTLTQTPERRFDTTCRLPYPYCVNTFDTLWQIPVGAKECRMMASIDIKIRKLISMFSYMSWILKRSGFSCIVVFLSCHVGTWRRTVVNVYAWH